MTPYLDAAIGASKLITGSESDGADAVQEALLAAWQQLDRLREPAAFAAWFRKIVIREAIRASRKRGQVVSLNLETPAPAAALEAAINSRQLGRAIASLAPDDRVLVVIRHYWRIPSAEAARLLDIPEGTVKSRLHHALERLRAAYDAEDRR